MNRLEWVSTSIPLLAGARSVSTGAIASQLLPILAMPVLSRLYSPEQHGVYGAFAGYLAIGTMVGNLGLEQAVVIEKANRNAWRIATISQWLAKYIGILICCIILLPRILNEGFVFTNILFGLFLTLSLFFVLRTKMTEALCVRFHCITQMNKGKFVRAISMPVIQVPLYSLNYGLILGRTTAEALSWLWYKKSSANNEMPRLFNDKLSLKRKLSIIWRYRDYLVYNAPWTFFASLPVVGATGIVCHFMDAFSVGQFSMAQRMVLLPLSLISLPIRQMFLKNAAKKYHSGLLTSSDVKRLVLRLGLYGFLFVSIACILGPFALPPLLGEKWGLAAILIPGFAIWGYFNFIMGPVQEVMKILNKQNLLMLNEIVFVLVRFLTLYLMINEGFTVVSSVNVFCGLGVLSYLIVYLMFIFYSNRELQSR